jgi:moderate conductance mechanosensitive channel
VIESRCDLRATLCLLAVLLLGVGASAWAQEIPALAPPAAEEPPAAPATAAEPPAVEQPAALSDQQLRQLLETLNDPERREELVRNLEALLAVQEEGPPAPTPEDAVGWLLMEITARTAVINQVGRAIVERVDDVPRLADWLVTQFTEPVNRAVWIGIGLRVLLVLALGILAYVSIAFVLRGLRARVFEARPETQLERVPLAIGWLLLELLPVVAFGLVAVASLTTLQLTTAARLVAMPLILAVLIVRALTSVIRVALAPTSPQLRLLPVGDEMASYAFRSIRRLLRVWVYGYFVLEAGWQLGLPWTLHGLLLHLLFFAVAVMAGVMILRVRQPVAEAIASLGGDDRPPLLRRLPWATLSSLWHLLALLYVLSIYIVWALRIPGGFTALLQATRGSVGIAIGGWLLWRTIDQLASRELQVPDQASDLLPGLERRANRYLPLLVTVARTLVLIVVGLGLLQVWGFGTIAWLLSEAGNVFLSRALTVLVIVVVTIGAWELISMMIERSMTDKDTEGNLRLSNRTRTLLNIVRNFLLVFLSLIALFLILTELGLNIAPLLAGAGVIGLAIGFGSQKLVQDIITGMFVLLGDTIRVGDVVEVAGRAGVVEAMTMRTVALRDLSGSLHTIPYSAIDTVKNLTQDFSYALLDLGVAYRESVDEVMDVLKDLGEEMNRDPYFRRHILEPLEILGVDAFADSAVIIRMRFKTRPLKQWEVAREFRRRIKNRFDELGIQIPYPHQTLYFGSDKQGRAAAARVRIEHEEGQSLERFAENEQAAEPPRLARSGSD